MSRAVFIGQWTFRIVTTLAPAIAVLQAQLVQHTLDPYALGSAIVSAILVGIFHYGRATAPGAAAGPPSEYGTGVGTIGGG